MPHTKLSCRFHRLPVHKLVGLIAWLAGGAVSAQMLPPWGQLAKGPYDVGFKIEQHFDRGRPYRLDVDPSQDAHARPVQMFIWYPARHRGSDRSLVYGDYLGLDSVTASGATVADRQRSVVEKRIASSTDPEGLREAVPRWLATRSRAVLEAPVADGRFPLLLVAPGGSTPGYLHAGLGEYLASEGYISVAIPSVPKRAGERWPFDHTGIDLHLRDQELALSHLLGWSSVDRGKIGLVAWSVGGVSQALMQMRNPDIDAVVSLDGATGYAYGKELIESSIFFAEEGITVPYLHATGLKPGQFEVEKDFTFFHSKSTDAHYLLSFEHLAHADFVANLRLESSLLSSETNDSVAESYATLVRVVKGFLDAYVERKAAGEERFRELIEDPFLAGLLSSARSGGEAGARRLEPR